MNLLSLHFTIKELDWWPCIGPFENFTTNNSVTIECNIDEINCKQLCKLAIRNRKSVKIT